MVVLMVDTCFLIDYQRESKRRKPGPVHAFLQGSREERLQISVVAWGEFIAGFADENAPFVRFARDGLDLMAMSPGVAPTYRKIYRSLKAAGSLIGGNDLWIASHAITLDIPLVTRNGSDFNRVTNLRLFTY